MSKRNRYPQKSKTEIKEPSTETPPSKRRSATLSIVDFKIGQCVIVKPGVKDPDLGTDIGGWQGRVRDIEIGEDNKPLVTFEWDSISLKQLTGTAIQHSEEEGLDWTAMSLYPEEIEHARPRDTQAEVEELIKEISSEHAWDYRDEQGRRIQQVLKDIVDVDEDEDEEYDEEDDEEADDDDLEAFDAWKNYLEGRLKFPFEAEVSEYQDRGPLQSGNKVTVLGIEDYEDLYGILVKIKKGARTYIFPLCDLEAKDKNTPNYTLVDDYAVWFANR